MERIVENLMNMSASEIERRFVWRAMNSHHDAFAEWPLEPYEFQMGLMDIAKVCIKYRDPHHLDVVCHIWRMFIEMADENGVETPFRELTITIA